MVEFVFFGDSICFGQGISPHRTWTVRLSAFLSASFPNLPLTIANQSVNGNTTRLALERMGMDIQPIRPDIILIQFGMNDCNYWQSDNGLSRVSLKSFAANLEEIIDRARASGAKRVLLNTNHLTQENGPLERKRATQAPRSYLENLLLYNEAIREVGLAAGAHVTDIEQHWRAETERIGELLLPDGIHLAQAGHDLYFSALQDTVRKAVSEAATEFTDVSG